MTAHPAHKRTAAQAAAGRKFAAAGRASQARKRAAEKAKGLPTRTAKQKQATLKYAAAGRAAQSRKRQGLKPLPTAKRALAGDPAVSPMGGMSAVSSLSRAACCPVDPLIILSETNLTQPCCAATAVAVHLYTMTGIMASDADIMALHLAAGGEDGAYIPDLLEIVSGGFAGTRLLRFWPVDLPLPGAIAGLRLPSGTHAALILSGATCVSWGRIRPLAGLEEAWWAEWASNPVITGTSARGR